MKHPIQGSLEIDSGSSPNSSGEGKTDHGEEAAQTPCAHRQKRQKSIPDTDVSKLTATSSSEKSHSILEFPQGELEQHISDIARELEEVVPPAERVNTESEQQVDEFTLTLPATARDPPRQHFDPDEVEALEAMNPCTDLTSPETK